MSADSAATAYIEALSALGSSKNLHGRSDPLRSWAPPCTTHGGAAAPDDGAREAAAPINEASLSDDLWRAVSCLPPPSAASAECAGAPARLAAALLASRRAAVPLAAARAAVSGALLGALGTPQWGPLALAAREARSAALERDSAAPISSLFLTRAEAIELSGVARVAGSRALALDAYAAQCSGRPADAWGAPRSAYDTERLESLTARADAHAALDSHFSSAVSGLFSTQPDRAGAPMSPPAVARQAFTTPGAGTDARSVIASPERAPLHRAATQASAFTPDADALLASAVILLELRRASLCAAGCVHVWAALEAARSLRPAAVRARGRFMALRTALGAARAVSLAAAPGPALPIAAALIASGYISSAASQEVAVHAAWADFTRAQAISQQAGKNAALSALSAAREYNNTLRELALTGSCASIAESDLQVLARRACGDARASLRAALTAGAFRGAPGAVLPPAEDLDGNLLEASIEAASIADDEARDADDAANDGTGFDSEVVSVSALISAARVILGLRRAVLADGAAALRDLDSVAFGGWAAVADNVGSNDRRRPWLESLRAAEAARPLADAAADADVALLSVSVDAAHICATLVRSTTLKTTAEAAAALSGATAFAARLRFEPDIALSDRRAPPPPLLLPLSRLVGALLSLRAAAAAAAADASAAASVMRSALTDVAASGAIVFAHGNARVAPEIALSLPHDLIAIADSELSEAVEGANEAEAVASALTRAAAIEDAVCARLALRARASETIACGVRAALAAEDSAAESGAPVGETASLALHWAETYLCVAAEGAEAGAVPGLLRALRRLVAMRDAISARDWASLSHAAGDGANKADGAAAALNHIVHASQRHRGEDGSAVDGDRALAAIRREAVSVSAVAAGEAALSLALSSLLRAVRAGGGGSSSHAPAALFSATSSRTAISTAISSGAAVPEAASSLADAAVALAEAVSALSDGDDDSLIATTARALACLDGVPISAAIGATARLEAGIILRDAKARKAVAEALNGFATLSSDCVDSFSVVEAEQLGKTHGQTGAPIYALRVAIGAFFWPLSSPLSRRSLLAAVESAAEAPGAPSLPGRVTAAIAAARGALAKAEATESSHVALVRGTSFAHDETRARVAAAAFAVAEATRALKPNAAVIRGAAEALRHSISLTVPTLPRDVAVALDFDAQRAALTFSINELAQTVHNALATPAFWSTGALESAEAALRSALCTPDSHAITTQEWTQHSELAEAARELAPILRVAAAGAITADDKAYSTVSALVGLHGTQTLSSALSTCGSECDRLQFQALCVSAPTRAVVSGSPAIASAVQRAREVVAIAAACGLVDELFKTALATFHSVLEPNQDFSDDAVLRPARLIRGELRSALADADAALRTIGPTPPPPAVSLRIESLRILVAVADSVSCGHFAEAGDAAATVAARDPSSLFSAELRALAMLAKAYSSCLSVSLALVSVVASPRPPVSGSPHLWPGLDTRSLSKGVPSLISVLNTADIGTFTIGAQLIRAAGGVLSARRALLAGDMTQLRLLLAARPSLSPLPKSTRIPRVLVDAWRDAAEAIDAELRVLASESTARFVSRGPLLGLLSTPPPASPSELSHLRATIGSAVASAHSRAAGVAVLDAPGEALLSLASAVCHAIDSATPLLSCAAERNVRGTLSALCVDQDADEYSVLAHINDAREKAAVVDVLTSAASDAADGDSDFVDALIAASQGAIATIVAVDKYVRVAAASAALAEALEFDTKENASAAASRAKAAMALYKRLCPRPEAHFEWLGPLMSHKEADFPSLGSVLTTVSCIAALRGARGAGRSERDITSALEAALVAPEFCADFTRTELEWLATEAELRSARAAVVAALRDGEPLRGVLLEAGAALERAGPIRAQACLVARRLLSLFPIAAAFCSLREARQSALLSGTVEQTQVVMFTADAALEALSSGAREAHIGTELSALLEEEARDSGMPQQPPSEEYGSAKADISICRARLSRAIARGAPEHEIVDETISLKKLFCVVLAKETSAAADEASADGGGGALPTIGSLLSGDDSAADSTLLSSRLPSFSLAACPALRSWPDFSAASTREGGVVIFSTPEEPAQSGVPWLAYAHGSSAIHAPRAALTSRAARDVLAHATRTLHKGIVEFCASGRALDEHTWEVSPMRPSEPSLSAVLCAQSTLAVTATHAPALDDEYFFAVLRIATAGGAARQRALALLAAAATAGAAPSPEAENSIEWFIRTGAASDSVAQLVAPLSPPESAALRAIHGAALRSANASQEPRDAPGAYSLRDTLRKAMGVDGH